MLFLESFNKKYNQHASNILLISTSMLSVEEHEQINRIIEGQLPTLRKRYQQFAYSILIEAKASYIHNPFELINTQLTNFSETIAKRQLQAMVVHIIQSQNEGIQLKLINEEDEFLQSQIVSVDDKDGKNIQRNTQQFGTFSKKTKINAMKQNYNKLRRFHETIEQDLVEPFEQKITQGSQNEELCFLVQLIQNLLKTNLKHEEDPQTKLVFKKISLLLLLKSKSIDDPKYLDMDQIQKIGRLIQMNELEFEIHGELRSGLFYQFYNQKNQKKIVQEYNQQIENNIMIKYRARLNGQGFLPSSQFINPMPKMSALNEQQIFTEFKQLSLQQINEIQREFKEWVIRLQRQSWKNELVCYRHRRKANYLREKEIIKHKIYLCNECISDRQQEHKTNEIVCKRHIKTIKCKLSYKQEEIIQQEQKQVEQQVFMCDQCLFYNRKQYELVCSCHYQSITEICIQEECIQLNEFMLCHFSKDKHERHRKLHFDHGQLMKQFGLEGTKDISFYQKELIQAKNMLKLDPIQKIRISFAEQTISTIRFLESLSVYGNQKVGEWVKPFMQKGKKEDLMVLKGILRMNEELFSEQNTLNYLEAFNYLLKRELQGMFQSIWKIVFHSCERINELKSMNKDEAVNVLNNKYESIIETQANNEVVVSPMKLSLINPIHHDQIRKIIVTKEREEQRDQIIMREWKDKRGAFFRLQIKKKLQEQQIKTQQQTEILKLFINAGQFEMQGLQSNIQQSNRLFPYYNVIKSLSELFQKIDLQFRSQLQTCLAWKNIIENKFINLRILHIQYASKYKSWSMFQKDYRNTIDAFALFQFVSNNPQLEQLSIKRAQIQNMSIFVQLLNLNNLTPLIVQKREENSWLKALQPSTALRIALQSTHILQSENFDSSLQGLLCFQRHFQWLSDIIVVIEFVGDDWGSYLERLFSCLRCIKKIQIIINRMSYLLVKKLLNGLALLAEISSLAFDSLNFTQEEGADFTVMENSLSALFDNNKITHLRLFRCFCFPLLPKKSTALESIQIQYVTFRGKFNVDQFMGVNPQLRSISIRQQELFDCGIEERLFNQLEYLLIKGFNDNPFRGIQSMAPSQLKHLSIQNYLQSNDLYLLQLIFPKLANLTQLTLSSFNFGYQLVSMIPSNHLEELIIQLNNKITNFDLQLIDSKWIYLKDLQLKSCPSITEKIFSLCKFKSLMQIKMDKDVLSSQGKKYVKGRGIIILQ